MPKVTVLLPVYNGEKHLREAIESILAQTFVDFELLIINDGSIDSSGDIIRAYRDPRIRSVDNGTNMGVTCSLNKGLSLAEGKYVARQDADDVSVKERLEKQIAFLDGHENVVLLASSYFRINDEGVEICRCDLKFGNETLRERLLRENFICHGSVMFRKENVQKIGKYRESFKFAQDYDLWLRLSESFDMTAIEEPLYKHRIRIDSISFDSKFEQDRYALLAKKLARERKQCGKDKLHCLKREDVDRVLDEIMPCTRRNRNVVMGSYYSEWAEILYCANRYSEARAWLLKSLMIAPWKGKPWILLIKTAICQILPPKLLRTLRSGLMGIRVISGKYL